MEIFPVFLLLSFWSRLVVGLAPLHRAGEKVPGSYIVKVKDGYDVDDVAQSLDSLYVLQRTGGARVGHRYRRSFRGFGVQLPSAESVELIQELEAVEYVAENGVVRVAAWEGAPASDEEKQGRETDEASPAGVTWNLDRVDQAELPLDGRYDPPNDGTGVMVYVLDTGIVPTHKDFEGRARPCFDAFYKDGIDCSGHGTHVSSVVAGAAYGVASNASVCGVRVLGKTCDLNGTVADVVAGIDWVAHNVKIPAVATLSLNMYGEHLPLSHALDGLINQTDMTVVVAAGNLDSDACYSSPAANDKVITVGATTREDERWYASNWGSCVDLFAPGSEILAVVRAEPNDTQIISGTSAACPHVAGAAAMLLADDHSLPHDAVKARLRAAATKGVLKFNKGNETEQLVGTDNRMLCLKTLLDKPERPQATKDVPADKQEPSQSNKDIPADKPERPQSNKEVPADKQEPSQSNKDIPADKPERPQSNKDVLADKPERPLSNKEVPADKPERPLSNKDVLTDKPLPWAMPFL